MIYWSSVYGLAVVHEAGGLELPRNSLAMNALHDNIYQFQSGMYLEPQTLFSKIS
jgi:hypothetical protein